MTKEVISFAFVGDDNELDYVPLDEVEFVKEMDIAVESKAVHVVESEARETFAIQIATIRDGHNSGRPYYLQVTEHKSFTELMQLLQRNSKAARKRSQARAVYPFCRARIMEHDMRDIPGAHDLSPRTVRRPQGVRLPTVPNLRRVPHRSGGRLHPVHPRARIVRHKTRLHMSVCPWLCGRWYAFTLAHMQACTHAAHPCLYSVTCARTRASERNHLCLHACLARTHASTIHERICPSETSPGPSHSPPQAAFLR